MRAPSGADQAEQPFPWKRAALAGIALVLLVGSLPLAERLVPARYPPGAVQTALDSLPTQDLDPASLQRFLGEEGAVALVGRALYPRYYAAGDGIPHGGWPSYAPRDYPRLGFVLVGPTSTPVVLPEASPPERFPNASDVLVLGCQQGDYIAAQLVVTLDGDKSMLRGSPSPALDCNTP